MVLLYTCAPGDGGCPTPTITDTANTTWSTPEIIGTVGHGADYMWYACNATGGSEAVTATNGSATYGMSLHVHEVRGVVANTCLDAIGTTTGTGASASVTTTTNVAAPREYVVAFFANNGQAGASSYLVGAGFTVASMSLNSVNDSALAEFADSSNVVGRPSATAIQTNPGAIWQAMIATFVAD